MNKEYLRAMAIAENALIQIKCIYENVDTEGFENYRGFKATESVIDYLEDFIRDIKHYSQSTKQGCLELNSNGRYVLNGIELTCGYPVELWNNKCHEWEDGRIEHSLKYGGYYFYNYDGEHVVLNDGIKARVRL